MTYRYSLFALCFVFSDMLFGGISVTSQYSYDQDGIVSFEGGDEVIGNIQDTITLPNAIHTFEVISASDDVYEIRSQAKIEANIDGRQIDGFSGDGWSQVRLEAFSATQFIDTAIVEGIDGQIGGIVEFLWNVDGSSTITLDPKLEQYAHAINELFTTAYFNTQLDQADPELLLNNEGFFPIGANNIESGIPEFFEPVVVAVDWLAGEELDVFFELQTRAVLDVLNLDAAGFEATVDSNFANTGTLTTIVIKDEQGTPIPDAYLQSTENGFIYDPEDLGLGGGGGSDDPLEVDIDIKPKSESNRLRINSKGLFPVAVLGSEELDVTSIDIDTILFGDPLLGDAVDPRRSKLRDVSRDGETDLLLRFRMRDLARAGAFTCDSTLGELTGMLLDGTPFSGADTISVLGSQHACSRWQTEHIPPAASVPEPATSPNLLIGILAMMSLRARRW